MIDVSSSSDRTAEHPELMPTATSGHRVYVFASDEIARGGLGCDGVRRPQVS
jgi:hypothetical protein